MKYDKRQIMRAAWSIFYKTSETFSECLHRAWNTAKAAPENEKRIMEAKTAAGIAEDTKTWYGWKKLGYEVVHGSKALFGVDLIYASKGDGQIYKARFFGRSQVVEIA